MISTIQKRKYIRVGTNLVAKASKIIKNEKIEQIVYIKNISATGAKIYSREKLANIGDTLNLKFKYKNILYDILCKIIRVEDKTNSYGVQFFFKNNSDTAMSITTDLCSNKNKLDNDILEEYFNYRSCFT